jgi:potassium-dependent mechanosensitive channel
MEDGQRNDALGRIAFIAGMVVTATAMHHVFRKQKGMFHEALVRSPQSWLNRVRIGGYLATTGTPCALAVLAAAGYYYSARQLAIRFELTMLIALCLGLAHGLASRWFLVKRRNLSIKQARERRSTQGESPSDNKSVSTAPNLSKIQSQLEILLRYVVVLAVLTVAWFVWSDVLPALRFFDRFVLWTTNEVPTTLTHAMLAVVFVVGTFIMGKNFPALLEITVLERLPIDNGGRNAATIIFRYLVYLSGLCLVARTVNISWSSVQWLAAAMTVGLGFGLQEIFANLVSGLIILFERPIRAGDLVTVNGVTGTVTRMQIRATTITDGDRREMIVPNKKFITEDVINWTLTDPSSRITIDVGVAYGSDAELAHSLLLKVAREHPLIMTEPPPNAIFKRFGESTLDFSLYVFIQTREVYGAVLHDLHIAIEREFRQANIEMAYPQRDVNIRSISASALPALTEITKTRAA